MVNGQKRRLSAPIKILFGGLGCGGLMAAGLFVLVGLIFGNNPFDLNPFDNAAFNRTVWLKDAQCDDGSNRRGSMAQDILTHQLQKGMTVAQVTALLDRPEGDVSVRNKGEYPNSRFTGREQRAPRILIYYLGEEQGGLRNGWFIDRAWLDLCFDTQDRYVGGEIFVP